MTENIFPRESPDAAYAKVTELMADMKLEGNFFNSGENHAKIVAGNIFRIAKKEIGMFSERMSGRFTNKPYVIDNVNKFLSDETRILYILLYSNPNTESNLYKAIEGKKNALLFVLNEDARNSLDRKDKIDYFMYGDDDMFRYEYDHKNSKAECSFNNPETTQQIKELFLNLKGNSVPYLER